MGGGREIGTAVMSGSQMSEEEILRAERAALGEEHRDLDAAIAALEAERGDPLALRRLKRRSWPSATGSPRIEDRLYPDIIA
jgi:hypothetical protein